MLVNIGRNLNVEPKRSSKIQSVCDTVKRNTIEQVKKSHMLLKSLPSTCNIFFCCCARGKRMFKKSIKCICKKQRTFD